MTLDVLFADLQTLARHDTRDVVFGATQHRWAHAPVPDAEIAAFEAAHGVTLPAGYRTWLGLVGAGAGPFYGLDPLPAEGAPGGTFDPHGAARTDGTVQLTHQGCGYFDRLVVTGPHAAARCSCSTPPSRPGSAPGSSAASPSG